MGRLSNDRKIDIVRAESNKKFYDKLSKAEKLLGEEVEKLSMKTRPKWYTEEVKNSQMVQTTKYAEVYWDGCENDDDYDQYDKCVNFEAFNYHPSKYGRSLRFEASKTLISRRKKVLQIINERDDFEQKLHRVLRSVNTDKKLVEHLPELSEYAEIGPKIGTALMPMEQIKEVRDMLK